ncbi:MAG: rRNA maturation RNase YbeY [Bacteroidales bacterium]|jgi:probable rRNA maturation factor|nr:rRNA maturation RNase YbeY [Bacteroidales bacterium]
MINYFNEDIIFNLNDKIIISKWLRNIVSKRELTIGQLNYIFCSDSYLLEINNRFLGHDYYTDVIAFDYSSDFEIQYGTNSVSGDIFISIDTVRRNAEIYKETFDKELHRVMVHGLLHLLGFDDLTPELQKEMRAEEDKTLSCLSPLLSER